MNKMFKKIDNLFGNLAKYMIYIVILIIIYLLGHKQIEGKIMFYEDYYNQKTNIK